MNKKKFFRLIEENYKNLEKFALHLSRNRDVAKDLLSETILKSYESRKSIRNDQAFLSFLFTICSRSYYRYISKSSKIEEQNVDELFSTEVSPEIKADIEIVYDFLDKLEPDDKEIILLHELSGFKYKEIAEIMDISIDNVKVKLHRAKQKFISMIEPNQSEKK